LLLPHPHISEEDPRVEELGGSGSHNCFRTAARRQLCGLISFDAFDILLIDIPHQYGYISTITSEHPANDCDCD